MKKLIKDLMLRLGVDAATAAKIVEAFKEDGEVPEGLTVDTIVAGAFAKLGETLATNEAFKVQVGKIRTGATGKLMDMLTKKLRKLFPEITDEQIEALPEEGTYDALVELAATLRAPKVKKEGEEDPEAKHAGELLKLNGLIRDLKKDNKRLTDEELPAAKNLGEKARERVAIERALERELSQGDGLVVDVEFATPSVLAKIEAVHDVALVDGKVKLFRKGTKDPDHDAEHNEITFEKRARTIATEAKLLKLNNGPAGGDKKKDEPAGGGGSENNDGRRLPPGLAKAKAHAEAMKTKPEGAAAGK